MAEGKFGTAVACIDGRAYGPVVEWIKKEFGVEYVDLVTAPGVDGVMVQHNAKKIGELKEAIGVSAAVHKSGVVVVAGHFDCAGNPVTEEEHKAEIRRDAEMVKSWGLGVEVAGVWVNESWEVERVA